MGFTKGEIDRIGKKIRSESNAVSSESLNALQEYRKSHEDSISKIFNILCKHSKQVKKESIVTFRIKRIDSIIRKLERYPDMRFSRMWDIGGCRCILKNDAQVYKLAGLIKQDLSVKSTKDYIAVPQSDGYRSLHLFVSLPDDNKTIEIQIRNQIDHNWSTLVEITDVLFDSKIKEYGKNKELLRFHFLLSKKHTGTLIDKMEIVNIMKKYKYFDSLSSVFSRNYLAVRKQWHDIENLKTQKYFLILASKDKVPKIESFVSYDEAEETYFNYYQKFQDFNIVLTHLENANFNQINTAYSNYVLTFHAFMTSSLIIIESLIINALKKRKVLSFIKYFGLYNNILYHHLRNLLDEIKTANEITIDKFKSSSHGKRRKNRKPKLPKGWEIDLERQVQQNRDRTNKFVKTLNKNLPKNNLERRLILKTINYISNKYRKRLQTKVKGNKDLVE